MKDKQPAPVDLGLGLFLTSVFLHCVSMTVLVYLRFSVGFAFLRPKGFFLACSWAFGLYVLYAWIDGVAWQHQRALLIFGCGGVVLYCLYLAIAFLREWRGGGEHDRYGGTSWTGKLADIIGLSAVFSGDVLHLWVEPAVVLVAALVTRNLFGAQSLAGWLFLAVGCLWGKAALNHWIFVRQHKRRRDALGDVEDEMEFPVPDGNSSRPNSAARKSRTVRRRTVSNVPEEPRH